MSIKKADKVLTLDEETGQVDAVLVGEEPQAVPAGKPGRAYFGQAKGYTSIVYLDGHPVYINTLSKKNYAEYAKREKEMAAEMMAIQKDSRKPNASPEAIEKRSDAVTEKQDTLYAWVVELAVKGWELPDVDGTPMPYTEELKAAMPIDIRCELCNYIIQKSRLGRDESSFLG